MKIFSLRALEEVMKEAARLASLEKVDKSLVLGEALKKGLTQIKLDVAIRLFAEGKLSISKAAEIAGVCVKESMCREIMEQLRERGIDLAIGLEDLRKSLEQALKRIKRS